MKRFYKKFEITFIFAITIALIHSCQFTGELPVINGDALDRAGELEIKEWQVVGPILLLDEHIGKFNSGLAIDELINFETTEKEITAEKFLKIRRRNARDKKKLAESFRNKRIEIMSDHFNFRDELRIDQPANTYLACQIQSSKEKDVVFLIGSDDGLKVWLNNEQIGEINVARKIHRYEDFIKVHLISGLNFLLVKTNNFREDWRLIFNISSIERGREEYRDYSMSDFLASSILQPGDSLRINLGVFANSPDTKIEISDMYNKTVLEEVLYFTGTWEKNLADFEEGFHTCRIIFPSDTFMQHFYYGNINEALQQYETRANKLLGRDDQIEINLNALFMRIRHLMTPKSISLSKHADLRLWKKKVMLVITELERILNNLEHDTGAFKHAPGIHLRGFRSRIDNQVQHYMLYIPEKYSKQKNIPLVIMMPYGVINGLPFLENLFVADILSIDRNTKFARDNGLGILWPHARGNTDSNPIEVTDVFEALDAVKTDYNIDEDRIYLNGVCSGGTRALILAARFPSLFAGVGLYSPYTYELSGFEQPDLYIPINFVSNFKHLPLYFVHSDKDEVAPIDHTLKFIEEAKKQDYTPLFKELNGVTHFCYPNRIQKDIFNFFKDKEREKNPGDIYFKTAELKYGRAYWLQITRKRTDCMAEIQAVNKGNNDIEIQTKNIIEYELFPDQLGYKQGTTLSLKSNTESFDVIIEGDTLIIDVKDENSGHYTGHQTWKNQEIEGPLSHAFSDRFILVRGTLGNENQQKILNKWFDIYRQIWQLRYQVDCQYKDDVQISDEDIRDSHLILLGDAKTNKIINQIEDRLPVKIESDKIMVKGKEYLGDKLIVNLIYPNPLNPKKYIVLISTNNMDYFDIGEPELSLRGWYDYAIWDVKDKSEIKLVDSAFFNEVWR